MKIFDSLKFRAKYLSAFAELFVVRSYENVSVNDLGHFVYQN